jgi:hypothetical protein
VTDRLAPVSSKFDVGTPWREDVADLLEDQLRLVIYKQQIGHLRGPESADGIVWIGIALSSKEDRFQWPITCQPAVFLPRAKLHPPGKCTVTLNHLATRIPAS